MNARTPFWPLLKHQLALGRFGGLGQVAGLVLVYWLCVGAMPMMVLYGDNNARGNIAAIFEAGFVPFLALLFLSSMTVWLTYATVPAFLEFLPPVEAVPGPIQNLGGFEFLLTRAIDRRALFRARALAFFTFALAPLFLNVLAAPLAPELSYGPANTGSVEAVQRHERYQQAFPASHPAAGRATVVPGHLVLPHGAVAFAGWVAWSGSLGFLLLQAYGSLIARRVKPNQWWTALYASVPMIALLLGLIFLGRGPSKGQARFFEDSFLLFATHPLLMILSLAALAVVIQTWCERRFSQLELL